MKYTIAYGTVVDMKLSSDYTSANVKDVDDKGKGYTEVDFIHSDSSGEFKKDPAVVATPIAKSEKQARVEKTSKMKDNKDGYRKKHCPINTYNQKGHDNQGLQNIDYSFIAVCDQPLDADVSNLQIIACQVDGIGKKKLNINYGDATLSSNKTGIYEVSFDKPFNKTPAAVATLARYSKNEKESKFRSVVIKSISTTSIQIEVFDEDSKHNDENFNLIVVGPASSGNAELYKVACGAVNRKGKFEFEEQTKKVSKEDNATYTITWDKDLFSSSKHPVIVACAEHSDEDHVRQMQVDPDSDSKEGIIQVANPDRDNYNDSNFHFIAIAQH